MTSFTNTPHTRRSSAEKYTNGKKKKKKRNKQKQKTITKNNNMPVVVNFSNSNFCLPTAELWTHPLTSILIQKYLFKIMQFVFWFKLSYPNHPREYKEWVKGRLKNNFWRIRQTWYFLDFFHLNWNIFIFFPKGTRQ